MATSHLALYPLSNVPPALQSPDYSPDELDNETFLTQSIVDLWETRQCYEEEVESDRRRMRHLNGTLGQMLFNLKAILARPGRNGQWSRWLADRNIARSSADRLVNHFAKSIGLKSPLGAIPGQEPTEAEIGKLFGAVWLRLERKLTTPQSIYDFLCCLITRSGLPHHYQPTGVLIIDPAKVAAPEEPEPATLPQEATMAREVADYPDEDVL
jgi:hypothetical protein